MSELFPEVIKETLEITFLVLLTMITIDVVSVFTKGKLDEFLKNKKYMQYVTASFLGTIPGCFGGFTNVSLYIHRLISFGAITGGMIASSGDEAFVMISLFPKKALFLFLLLFISGIIFGILIDYIYPLFKIKPCTECVLQEYHAEDFSFSHYLKVHVWDHLLKKHLWKLFIWTFLTLLSIEFLMKFWNLETFVKNNLLLVFLFAAALAILPESGPHLIFVMMFSKGMIPFSVLFVSAFAQDGHGMLPMLSYSIKDFFYIKFFNIIIGLLIGVILFGFGY
ncbi:MAG: putative manganese transporter [Acidobacteriota bacterium]